VVQFSAASREFSVFPQLPYWPWSNPDNPINGHRVLKGPAGIKLSTLVPKLRISVTVTPLPHTPP